MFGFPISNGNAGFNEFVEKFTNNADSGFPKIQQREVFYTLKDGNWNDLTIWQTASGRIGNFPTALDDVYIKHNIAGNTTTTINGLFVSGIFTINAGITLSLNDKFIGAGNSQLINKGILNFLTQISAEQSFSSGIYDVTSFSNTVIYSSNYSATIPSYFNTFYNLTIGNNVPSNSVKTLSTNTTLLGNLIVNEIFDTSTYNLTINGTSQINGNATTLSNFCLRSSGAGNILFIGNLNTGNGVRGLDFSGNPNIEFRGGLRTTNNSGSPWGTGNISFTTNNQTLDGVASFSIPGFTISGAITLTVLSSVYSIGVSGIINGNNAASKLLMGNNATIYFTTQVAAEGFMSVGIFDNTTNVNTIGYIGLYTATIPSRFPTFHNLKMDGNATKTLSVNTTLNGTLVLTNGNFELSTFNLTVNGTTTADNVYSFSKTGAGSVIFVGSIALKSGVGALSFTGNPTVEFRNGFTVPSGSPTATNWIYGTGQWSFTTNNQNISSFTVNDVGVIPAPILISGAITVTNNGGFIFDGTLNGDNAASKFLMGTNAKLNFNTQTAAENSMTTGIFDVTTNVNTIAYGGNYSATIPSRFPSFYNLTISGTGTKTLGVNTTLSGNFVLGTSGTFEMSTFNFTVNGTTNTNAGTLFSKTGAGAIVFVGLVTYKGSLNSQVFSGNPTIEYRNGFTIPSGTPSQNCIVSGSGQWSFTTNSQSWTLATGSNNINIAAPILISGAITVSVYGYFTLSSTINGNNAASTFTNGTATLASTLIYNSATQPMAIGVLDTSTNANTWIYGLNAQDIKGGPSLVAKQVYRNLTLNGTGVKTLQGYVSVLNTYTLTSPATLALNGFTLTNP